MMVHIKNSEIHQTLEFLRSKHFSRSMSTTHS
jgi:hypothetical protein